MAAAGFMGVSLGFTQHAAAEPVQQGTMILAAERMAGFALYLGNGNAEGSVTLFNPLFSPFAYQFPRVGFDYFVIDGLSIGGHAGVSHFYNTTVLTFLPRVGYAFSLSDTIDFWPRGGVGYLGLDGGGGMTHVAFLNFEGMFLWNFIEHAGLEFGPTLDVGLTDGGHTELGGNLGIFARF